MEGSSLFNGGYAIPLQSADGSLQDLAMPRTLSSTSNADFDVMEVGTAFTLAYELQRLDWYGFTNPVFIDGDGSASFEPPGVP